jgi:hypothetical protein
VHWRGLGEALKTSKALTAGKNSKGKENIVPIVNIVNMVDIVEPI